MSMNITPKGERIHIALFGRRNAGKSSLLNAITGQELSIVSDIKGTTTDPVFKAMELLPLGPVMFIDTPGLDDDGQLGALRIQKTKAILSKTDIALIIADGREALSDFSYENKILSIVNERRIPALVIMNKQDQWTKEEETQITKKGYLAVSAVTHYQIEELKNRIATSFLPDESTPRIIGDLLSPGDYVILVVPIDSSAPKGRLILPQQQVIRDVLESGAISLVCRESEVGRTITGLMTKPRFVITDSQVFPLVSKEVPQDIPLTSFSILFSRYKGNLLTQIQGVETLDSLIDGDRILLAEGCTHHRQCNDIGTVILPRRIREYTGKQLHFDATSGNTFPEDLSPYRMIIHCGGCTLSKREMTFRITAAQRQSIPFANYGMVFAFLDGILQRCTAPFI